MACHLARHTFNQRYDFGVVEVMSTTNVATSIWTSGETSLNKTLDVPKLPPIPVSVLNLNGDVPNRSEGSDVGAAKQMFVNARHIVGLPVPLIYHLSLAAKLLVQRITYQC